jgi:hypothetical protein
MSDYEQPSLNRPRGTSYSILDTWIRILTDPSVYTFQQIIDDPKASAFRGLASVFVVSLITSGFAVFNYVPLRVNFTSQINPSLWTVVPVTIVLALLNVIMFLVVISVNHFASKIMDGEGSYGQIIYALCAFSAPLSLPVGILAPFPGINLFTIPIVLYSVVLTATAYKAVHRFSWTQVIIASIIFPIIVSVALAGLLIWATSALS